MVEDRNNDLVAFKTFLDEELSLGAVETLDEALGLWEFESQAAEEREHTLESNPTRTSRRRRR